MAKHNELGKRGEELALNFLKEKQYSILETNWRWEKAEVDIIASFNQCIIFIEVKTRTWGSIIKPEEAVSVRKQQLFAEAAEAYCELNAIEQEIKFEIVAILYAEHTFQIKHIENAF